MYSISPSFKASQLAGYSIVYFLLLSTSTFQVSPDKVVIEKVRAIIRVFKVIGLRLNHKK
jgi:hypothetical protein